MVLALIFSYVKIQKRLLQFRSSIALWNLILKNKINIQFEYFIKLSFISAITRSIACSLTETWPSNSASTLNYSKRPTSLPDWMAIWLDSAVWNSSKRNPKIWAWTRSRLNMSWSTSRRTKAATCTVKALNCSVHAGSIDDHISCLCAVNNSTTIIYNKY